MYTKEFTEYRRFENDPQVVAYKKFMYNESNIYNCLECPENKTGEYRGCGQQNCWVYCHIKSGNEEEE